MSGEGEGERHLEAARARLVVLREAAPLAELELAADLGRLESARPELELANARTPGVKAKPLCADRLQWQAWKAPVV